MAYGDGDTELALRNEIQQLRAKNLHLQMIQSNGTKKTKYTVVVGSSLQELEDGVTKMLEEGWEIVPGFFALRYTWTNERKGNEESEIEYYQPLVHK